ncbi:PREDICTED: uncharacterized protein LOC105569946 [Vollenhovia emeryi]|uniref:uncharacterized protein LOC105569946 n=1 Tax=Vollenhovia emeryi TaxID=411798 RepID=UPI0005F4F373|nr:PREDICTED: uncharacterized protein LOC105569946 [Vollenhovia emeryi]
MLIRLSIVFKTFTGRQLCYFSRKVKKHRVVALSSRQANRISPTTGTPLDSLSPAASYASGMVEIVQVPSSQSKANNIRDAACGCRKRTGRRAIVNHTIDMGSSSWPSIKHRGVQNRAGEEGEAEVSSSRRLGT